MNVSIVRPLVDQLYKLQDVSVGKKIPYQFRIQPFNWPFSVYCLLVNRTQFLREQANAPHYQSVNISRAILCEMVANRILRRYNEVNPGPQGLLLLANILVAGFDPFQNAPEDVIRENSQFSHWTLQQRSGSERKIPALEIAIISESKLFLSSSACQKVVSAIYEGRVVYTPSSFIDILPDHYKQKPISLYDPRKAPLFNQYRLIVPRTRNYLEVGQFMVLLCLYVTVMNSSEPAIISKTEILFAIYTLGWVLDQFASILEHGWGVYTQNLWSFLDVTFAFIYFVYVFLRLQGLRVNDIESGRQALDVLAIGAPVLIPRLAFNLMSENMLFVSLRSMMADFTVLTVLAAWCFAGFLLSMIWLGDGEHRPITIAKWMLWVWFGLDGTGIQRSVDLHQYLGPMLMVAFAFLGNTLFLTILVSMLSNTFANIVSNASAEIQYRRSVLTLEGVKSDAIFAYQPPFNILALCTLLPLKFFVSPRWFHKVNVAAVRTLNAPLLLIIGYLERRSLWSGSRRGGMDRPGLTRTRSRQGLWSRGFSAHGDIEAVFDSAPEVEMDDEDFAPMDEVDGIEVYGSDEHQAESNKAKGSAGNGNEIESGNKNSNPPDAGGGDASAKWTERTKSIAGSERPMLSRRNTSELFLSRVQSRSRRDSMAPFGGLRDHLMDMLNEVAAEEGEQQDDDGDDYNDDTGSPGGGGGGKRTKKALLVEGRLEKLECSIERIEIMLGRLCKDLKEEVDEKEEEAEAEVEPLEEGDQRLAAEEHQ
jgi:hypothetical protein